MIRPSSLILLGLLLSVAPLGAQTWDFFRAHPDAANESVLQMTALDTDILLAGTYDGPLQLGNQSTPGTGTIDLFLTRTQPDGTHLWTLFGEGPATDNSQAIAVDNGSTLYWAGSFVDELDLGTEVLTSESGKALFLIALNPDGTLLWTRVFEGTGGKEIRDIVLDETGQIYCTGFFSETLTFGDTTLESPDEDALFLAALDPTGQPLWATRSQGTGSILPEAITYNAFSQEILVVGRYNDTLRWAGDTLPALTFDFDGFLLAAETDGTPTWIRKVGAQYDDRVNDVVAAANGAIFITGTFVGVLEVEPGWEITTPGFNNNAFLLGYSSSGTPQFARSLGSLDNESASAITLRNEGPVVTGTFSNHLTVDGQTVSGMGGVFSTYLAGFYPDGDLRWLQSLPGDDIVIPQTICVDANNQVWGGGTFAGTISIDNTSETAVGNFDAWWGRLQENATSISRNVPAPFHLFPNPADQWITLEGIALGTPVEIVNQHGQRALITPANEQIYVGYLPNGWYTLRIAGTPGAVPLLILHP